MSKWMQVARDLGYGQNIMWRLRKNIPKRCRPIFGDFLDVFKLVLKF